MDIENSKDILFYSQQIERKNLIRMEDWNTRCGSLLKHFLYIFMFGMKIDLKFDVKLGSS